MARRYSVWVACIGAVAGLVGTYLASSAWWEALISVAVMSWFVLPGMSVARRLIHSESSLIRWALGPALGVAASTLGLLVLWVFGFRGPWILFVAPWPLWLLRMLPLRRAGIVLDVPAFGRRDLVAISLLLLIVPAIAAAPYGHVASVTPDGGKSYRAYFTADFVWAMAVVSEVSKGDFPPVNPFLRGSALHYYWLSHFLSAVEYREVSHLGASVEQVTLANSIGFTVIFITFLYSVARAFGGATGAAGLACALVFLANSFEAMDRIWAWQDQPAIWPLLKDVNVDAVSRWFYEGMPVDGLHRMILYQPHHFGGYAVGLSALLLVSRARDVARPLLALTAGTLLAACLMFSSFIAIIIGVAVALVYAARLREVFNWRTVAACAVMGAVPVLLAVLASTALGYVDPSAGPIISFGPNRVALKHWPYLMLLNFGPMLILGAMGVFVVTLRGRDGWPMAVLALVALAFYFLVDVPDMQHVWVGWRAGHLLFVACTVLVALLFTEMAMASPNARSALAVLTAVLAIAAVPTTAVDVFNAQDIDNRGAGPSFPWTLVLTPAEVEALTWVKSHTRQSAVVQPDVRVRKSDSWGYIPSFGERRMAAGLPIAMIPMQPYIDASEEIGEHVFTRGGPRDR